MEIGRRRPSEGDVIEPPVVVPVPRPEYRVPNVAQLAEMKGIQPFWLRAATVSQPTQSWEAGNRVPRPAPGGPDEPVQRTLSNRAWRAEQAEALQAVRHQAEAAERLSAVSSEARLRDEFDRQLIKQTEYTVPTQWGELKAYGAVIDLTQSPTWPAEKPKPELPPVYFIPAFSGDLYGIAPLLRELTLQGRRVVSIAYPESFTGTPNEAFAEAVEGNESFGPHTEFFTNAFVQLQPDTKGEVELWGYSTGGGVAATLLSEPAWQERVAKAVLVYPASLVDQSPLRLIFTAAVVDGLRLLPRREKLYDSGIVTGPKVGEKHELRDRIANRVMALAGHRIEAYNTMRVREGGKIVIPAGKRDAITRGWRAKQHFAGHPQAQVIEMEGAIHTTALTEAKKVMELLDAAEQA